jgi:hypothetical protein
MAKVEIRAAGKSNCHKGLGIRTPLSRRRSQAPPSSAFQGDGKRRSVNRPIFNERGAAKWPRLTPRRLPPPATPQLAATMAAAGVHVRLACPNLPKKSLGLQTLKRAIYGARWFHSRQFGCEYASASAVSAAQPLHETRDRCLGLYAKRASSSSLKIFL